MHNKSIMRGIEDSVADYRLSLFKYINFKCREFLLQGVEKVKKNNKKQLHKCG